MKSKLLKRKTKGSIYATAVLFMQGFEGLLFPLFGFAISYTIYQSAAFSTASLALKEILTLFIVFALTGPKKVKWILNKIIKEKNARLFMFASFGTIFGNLMYIMAVQFAGAGYGLILTALYPVFSMILISWLMKEKEGWIVWFGVFIASMGSLLFTVLPIVIHGSEKISFLRIIGIILGMLSAFFWAIESFFLNKGIKKKSNKDFSNTDSVFIRSFFSGLISLVVLMPLVTTINAIHPSESFQNSFVVFFKMITNWKSILIIFAISLNLIFLRKFHFFAIYYAGAKLTSMIDSNNFLVTPLFSIFLSYAPWTFKESPHPGLAMYEPIIWWAWFLIIPIAVGVFIVIYYHKPKKDESLEEPH